MWGKPPGSQPSVNLIRWKERWQGGDTEWGRREDDPEEDMSGGVTEEEDTRADWARPCLFMPVV